MYPDKISIDDTYWWPAPKDELVEYVRAPVWIPVSERLPNKGDEVLVYNGDYIESVEYINNDFWMTMDDGEVENVTHWMPLPAPPEAEE